MHDHSAESVPPHAGQATSPVALVTLFMTALFGRNLDDNRPHLGPGLIWLPAVAHTRLMSLATLIVPYRRETTIQRGIAVTCEVLRATVALATARGATPLIVVPQFNREDDLERTLRRRILDDAGLPYVFVEFDDGWRIPGDLHPNAPTARRIAMAIANRLRATPTSGRHDAEHGSTGADANRENENGDDREPRLAPQLASGVEQVAQQCVHGSHRLTRPSAKQLPTPTGGLFEEITSALTLPALARDPCCAAVVRGAHP